MERLPRRRFHLPRHQRYPIWNAATVTFVAVLTVASAASVVLLSLRRPLIEEMALTISVVAVCLFALLLYGLYHGVRVRRERFALPSMPSANTWSDSTTGLDVPDLSGLADGDEFGCLGAIAGLVIGFVLMLLLIALLMFALPVIYGTVALVAVAVWWVCYLALRRAFVYSRRCRGNLSRSAGYALLFTLLYSGWLFAVLAVWAWVI